MQIILGSTNQDKLREMREILCDPSVELISPADVLKEPLEVEETGKTFEENACLKAHAYAQASGMWALADDSGIAVDALDGRPGIYSARFGGPGASNEDNNRKMLDMLKDVPDDKRTARYQCVIAVATPDHLLLTAAGSCEGRILRACQGDGGFGYDPLFYYPFFGCTFAEVDACRKHRVSHRGAALEALREKLLAVVAEEEKEGRD